MSITEIKGDNSPAGILKHWQNRTKYECAREILSCYERIERQHRELMEIFRITSDVAGVTGPNSDDLTLTVRRVRDMAQMINWIGASLSLQLSHERPQQQPPESYIFTLNRSIALVEAEQEKCGPSGIGDAVWFDTDIDRLRELVAEQRIRAQGRHDHEPTITSGMKAECMGEFEFTIEETCSACYFDEPQDDCEVCQGSIHFKRKVTVPWNTCKEIYKRMTKASTKSANQENSHG